MGIDAIIARLRPISALCCLLFMPGLISAEGDEATQATWYQIELIVFSNQRESSSGELWPAQTLQYPAKMLSIGPTLDEQLSPRNLIQLKILQGGQQLPETTTEIIGIEARNAEFLFDDPGLRAPDRSKPGRSGGLLEEDLLVGLIRERPVEMDTRLADTSVGAPDTVEEEDIQLPDLGLLFQENPLHQAFRTLPRKEFALDILARRIDRSPYYHLLYHSAWRQPVQSMDKAIPVLLQAGNQYDDYSELDGFITISRARYLHIDTDLWFTTFSPRSGQASIVMPDKTLHYPQSDRELLRQYPDIHLFESRRNNYFPVQTYRMVQSRRMRSSTLHYLDHPAFSLLIRIDKFSFPEDESF